MTEARTFVLATTNRHKAREIATILAPLCVEVDVPASLPPVEEDGHTFAENALKKARSAARATGRPAIADDSGLVVPSLDGAPGVLSARYAGDHATDDDNTRRLLDEVARAGLVDPEAYFVCHAVAVDANGAMLALNEAQVFGVVRGPPRGAHGFGYDPVFHHVCPRHPVPGARFSELPPVEKDACSHRGAAFRALAGALRRRG